VHQNLGLIDEMTVLENLRLTSDLQRGALAPTGLGSDRDARSLLQRIGMDIDLDAQVGTLPPVERAAVAIARAIDDSHGQVRLLALDEPTAAMSPTEVEKLFAIIREIKSAGASVLYISHRIDEILRLADTATVLRDGRMQGRFSTAQVSRSALIGRILGVQPAEESQPPAQAPDADGGAVCLNAAHISARYLRGVALTARRGEVLGVAGLDGSGRDELAQVLGGAVPAHVELTTAKSSISGHPTVSAARAAGIGLVLPNTHPGSLIGEFTVRENLCLPNAKITSRRGLISQRRERQSADMWLTNLDIRPREPDKKLQELSGGNRQKVAIAKILEQEPDVLVMDDPTSGVDVGARRAIYDIIQQRASGGTAVIICSSDAEDLISTSDRILCLVAGKIVAELRGSDISEQSILHHIVSEGGPSPQGAQA
jgi:ribose transport system ATP-binding protein